MTSRQSTRSDAPRTWLRGLQLVLSLLTAGTIIVLMVWTAISVYYVVRGAAGVFVGASLPNARQLDLPAVVPGLVSGATLETGRELPIAIAEPSPVEFGLALLQHLPTLAVYATFFALLLRAVRAAEEAGPFRAPYARQIRRLGVFLIVAALAAALVEAVAQGMLATMVLVDGRFLMHYDFPTGAIVGGIGLLAVSDILRRGERLREDLEGTV